MKLQAQKLQAFERLQKRIAYSFNNSVLLQQALTHRSFHSKNNERFEFVGDSILNYVVAKMLFETYPKLSEGRLSRLRANLVNQTILAEIATSLNLGEALFLGTGELKSGGHTRPSILADALEALFAAVSFDSDFSKAEQLIRTLFIERVAKADEQPHIKDPKTRLQETLQAMRFPVPKYRIEKQSGEGVNAKFDISCDLGEIGHITYATASSRRAAEQDAAQLALAWLEEMGKIKPIQSAAK